MTDDEYKLTYGIQELKHSINFLYSITPTKKEFLLAMCDGFYNQLLKEIQQT